VLLVVDCQLTTITRQLRPFIQAEVCNLAPVMTVVRMGLCRKMICELYQMLKKGEYHYFRDPLNHRTKMEDYFKLLEQRHIQIPEGLKKSAFAIAG
jgi:hypothetical protein